MNLSTENLLNQALLQVENQLPSQLISPLKQVMDRQADSLGELIQARNDGELTHSEFEMELAREQQIAEAELLTLQIATKAEVQQAINQAFSALVHTAL